MIIWYAIQKWGKEGMLKRAKNCLENAAFLRDKLNEIGISAWSNPNALTVVFPKPCVHICKKWQLATENEIAHVICMPGITKEKLMEFVDDLKMSK